MFFVFFLLFAKTFAVHIQYSNSNQTRIEANISTTELNEGTFDTKIFWLYLIKYEPNEDQIETINNITHLEHIDIYSVGQKLMPIFRNLPKIKHIAIKGNNIFYLSNGALSQVPVQEIYLDNNQIENIENWSFGPAVNTLYLSCNKLKKISSKWFTNTTNLKELDLSGNEIISLPENIFKPFKSLNLIALSHNKIKTIGKGAFSNRNSFWILYLDNNKLTKLPVEAFQNNSLEIHSMHLQYNLLSFLDKDFLKNTNTTKARLQGNPWQCSCFEFIKNWNSWEYFESEKEPPKCILNKKHCVYDIDLKVINEYQKQYPPNENAETFCKNYLK